MSSPLAILSTQGSSFQTNPSFVIISSGKGRVVAVRYIIYLADTMSYHPREHDPTVENQATISQIVTDFLSTASNLIVPRPKLPTSISYLRSINRTELVGPLLLPKQTHCFIPGHIQSTLVHFLPSYAWDIFHFNISIRSLVPTSSSFPWMSRLYTPPPIRKVLGLSVYFLNKDPPFPLYKHSHLLVKVCPYPQKPNF